MKKLPNDHHPGPRCSCAECLRKYPEAQPTSKESVDKPTRNDAEQIERLQRDQLVYDDLTRTISSQLDTIERLQLEVVTLKKCLYDEQHGITAETRSGQPPPSTPNIAAIRAIIAEMIAVAADWTADNCAQVDAWQVRLADALTKSGDAP